MSLENNHHSQPVKPRLSSKKSRPNWMLLGFGLSAIAAISASIGAVLALSLSQTPFRQAQLTPEEEAVFNQEETLSYSSLEIPKLSRPVNILVLGVKVLTSDLPEKPDQDLGYHALVNSFKGLSDSMLLLRFDPEQDQLMVLSIPRDTKTLIPGHGVRKINEANYHGGPALTAESVSHLLNGVNIDRYIRVNVQGIEKLIDALGGVNLFVPKDMKYTDESQHLYINLKQGEQHLNGAESVQFLRFRYDAYGDIGRIQRQQLLIRALKEQALSPKTILKLPEILSVVRSHIDTNITTDELLALASFAGQKSRSDFQLLMLPGDFNTPEEGELSYWLPHHRRINQMMAQHFDVEDESYASKYSDSGISNSRLRIAVQYNENNQEQAQQMVQYLQKSGYNRTFLYWESYTEPLNQTKIVAQKGDHLSAFQVLHDLGVGEVFVESTGVLASDITIQVADDWQLPESVPDSSNQGFQTTSY